MLSLRASDYLGPQVLCSKGEPGEEVRKVRSASEGRYEWPMSLPVEGAEPLPWFRPREPLYPPPAYQRYPRFPYAARPFPEGLPFPPEASPPAGYYRGGSLKHRILHPPPSIRIVEPPAALLAAAPLSAPPIPLAEGPRLAVSSMHPPGGASRLHYPAYFLKGSIIQLGTGLLKKVEDLHTEDFVTSANVSRDLRIDSSRVLQMATGDSVATLSFSVGQNQVQVRVQVRVPTGAADPRPFAGHGRGARRAPLLRLQPGLVLVQPGAIAAALPPPVPTPLGGRRVHLAHAPGRQVSRRPPVSG